MPRLLEFSQLVGARDNFLALLRNDLKTSGPDTWDFQLDQVIQAAIELGAKVGRER